MKAITKLAVAAVGASSVTLAGVAPRAGPNPFEGMDKLQRLPGQGHR